jgi:hypothetical protein
VIGDLRHSVFTFILVVLRTQFGKHNLHTLNLKGRETKQMNTALKVGEVKFAKGFCTHAVVLRGRYLGELETLLGYRNGRLAAGATVLFLDCLLTPEDFRLGGYNYFSDGTLRGHKLPPESRDPYRMEALLKREHRWSDEQIKGFKRNMIGRSLVLKDSQRVAKLIPATPHMGPEEYPPGEGIFQIELIRLVRFRVKATIAPGQKWLGDYQDPQ